MVEPTSKTAAGSKIGLAASVVRELAAAQEKTKTAPRTVTESTPEVERDTKITRSQDETRKSSPVKTPSLMPNDLGLARLPEDQSASKGTVAKEKEDNLTPEQRKKIEASVIQQISHLEKELTPLHSTNDSLLSGAKVRVERRLAPAESKREELPSWIWPAVAGGLLAVVVIVALIITMMR